MEDASLFEILVGLYCSGFGGLGVACCL
jgi:hypothetical protein